jgi:hypothetical protein
VRMLEIALDNNPRQGLHTHLYSSLRSGQIPRMVLHWWFVPVRASVGP